MSGLPRRRVGPSCPVSSGSPGCCTQVLSGEDGSARLGRAFPRWASRFPSPRSAGLRRVSLNFRSLLASRTQVPKPRHPLPPAPGLMLRDLITSASHCQVRAFRGLLCIWLIHLCARHLRLHSQFIVLCLLPWRFG